MTFNAIEVGQTTHHSHKKLQIPRKRVAEPTKSTDLLFHAGPIRITERERSIALCSNAYANDAILDFYARFLEEGFPYPQSHIFHTQFYTLLKQSFREIENFEKVLYDSQSADSFSKASTFETIFRPGARVLHCDVKTKCILNCESLFIPICRNEHWFTICVVNPKIFFLRHLPQHVRTKIREHTYSRKDGSAAAREDIVTRRILRRPLRSSRASMGDFVRISGKELSSKTTSATFRPESAISTSVEPFLTYNRLVQCPPTAIFFIDSLLGPRNASTDRSKIKLQQYMIEILRPIALFLIHRLHAELCIAFNEDNVLSNGFLCLLYAQFFGRDGIWWAILCVPQQRSYSVDCGFFTLHCMEILRHPDVLKRLVEYARTASDNIDTKKRLFHNIVFNSRIHTNNLFEANAIRQKRKYIADLVNFITAKIRQSIGQSEFNMLCKHDYTDKNVQAVVSLIRHPTL